MTDLAHVFQVALPLPTTDRPSERRHAAALYAGALGSLVVGLITLLPPALKATADLTGWERLPLAVSQIALIAAAAWVYALTRRAAYRPAALVLTVMLLAESAVLLWDGAWASPRGWIAQLGALLLAGVLLDRRTASLIGGAGLLLAGASVLHGYGNLSSQAQTGRWLDFGTLIVWSLALGGAVFAAQTDDQRVAAAPADDSGLEHVIALGAVLARGLFAHAELDSLLGQIADSLQERFPADSVQIYVVPPQGPQASLRAATGPAGLALVAQDYAVDVGGLSAVGRVTRTGQPLFIRDYQQDAVHTPHPLLAAMRSELALPLSGRDGVIGALTLQSTQPDAFDEAARTALGAIATQLALALDALTAHEEARRSLRENQALFQQSQAHLREIERLNFDLTGRVWDDFLRQPTGNTALTLDLDSGQVQPAADWTATLDAAARQGHALAVPDEGRTVIACPITVRGEVVGAMEFELEAGQRLPPDALRLANAVGQRLGQSLENRRLFDETQRSAQREAIVNAIGADLQNASGVEAIVQRAAHHLQATLGARSVAIRIGPPPLDASRSGDSQP